MNAIVPINAAPVMPMADIERVAIAIAKGGLFGSTDPNAVLTLCLLAHAEGQHPAVVFRDYHIIQGKPAKKADAMLRDFVQAGGTVKWHQLDNETADATFSHPGGGTVRIDWTMERARQAQLATPMWKKYPRQMLRSRVISEGVRTVYPGATSGLYEVGEVQDIVAEQPAPAGNREAPADYTPAAIEHQSQGSGKRRRPPLEGPIKTREALRIACGEFARELHACEDEETLEVFLATDDAKALTDQVEKEDEYLWKGDGADFIGLNGEINAARVRVMSAEAA